jgi:DNA-binding MurR/RpiR family transcriptional regulator
MKKSELRQMIKEELTKENFIPNLFKSSQYVIVDANEPYQEETIFEGNLNQIKNKLLQMLKNNELEGLDFMEKGEWEQIRSDNIN